MTEGCIPLSWGTRATGHTWTPGDDRLFCFPNVAWIRDMIRFIGMASDTELRGTVTASKGYSFHYAN